MPVEIIMPELGESVHEARVNKWLKKEGDPVKEDEPVVEIMTDKVNTELGAPATGVLVKILVPEGEDVRVFQPIGLIAQPGETLEVPQGGEDGRKQGTLPETPAPPTPKPQEPPPTLVTTTPPPPISAKPPTEKRWYSPLVRSMAKEHGISLEELARIPGSGEGGRVTKSDVLAYLQSRQRVAGPPLEAPRPPAPPPAVAPGPEQEVVALTGMRRAIAEAMIRAHQIPSVSTVTQVDVTPLVEFRRANKESFEQTYGVRLTYTPFFIKAATEALLKFPMVNSAYVEEGKLLMNRSVHMGVAVALGDGTEGLIVPVIRNCHQKTLIDIARDLEDLARRARENKIELPELQGATFTLTNPGSYGALIGTPMIPPGQGAILGTYAIQEVPVVREGMIAIRSVMHLVLTYDHRIIDGMLAGRFLQAIKKQLETLDFFR
ncbi:MAG: 2-oxo acid dehydrogenase subunit E2 [Fimbriimonadales bacterium]|nr:2-oxo acid dehydrogenase subunit E2 [Fimbriimonadales bacterium]